MALRTAASCTAPGRKRWAISQPLDVGGRLGCSGSPLSPAWSAATSRSPPSPSEPGDDPRELGGGGRAGEGDIQVKAISLWQPWASLWVLGFKRNETRSWATSHRGSLAVQAAKFMPTAELYALFQRPEGEPFVRVLESIGCSVDRRIPGRTLVGRGALPRGAIIGTVNVSGCERITAENYPIGDERAFGDYTAGRFMWPTSDRKSFATPIHYRGAQGFFEVPDSILPTEVPMSPQPPAMAEIERAGR